MPGKTVSFGVVNQRGYYSFSFLNKGKEIIRVRNREGLYSVGHEIN